MYRVLHFFHDLQDNNYVYNPGDVFPHEGLQVSEERIAELSGPDNKQHKPLIAKVEEEPAEEEPKKAAPKRTAKKAAAE